MLEFMIISFILPCQFAKGVISMSILEKLKGKTSEDILSTYGDKSKFPVDIVAIAQDIGIRLGSTDFTELEKKDSFKDIVKERGHILGAVTFKDDKLSIVYHNALHDKEETDDDSQFKNLSDVDKKDKIIRRQRFTIAHEIAHCCLHMNDDSVVHIEYRTDQTNYESPLEREANIFAGELLIPKDFLRDLCLILKNKVSLSYLADVFKVSKHVMEARLNYLIEEEGSLTGVEYY